MTFLLGMYNPILASYTKSHISRTVNTTLIAPSTDSDDLKIIMTDGSKCTTGSDLKASTAILFVCAKDTKQPRLLAQLPPNDETACGFVVEFRTPVRVQHSRMHLMFMMF